MDAQNQSQNPQGVSHTLLLKLFKICTTVDLSEIESNASRTQRKGSN